MRMNLAQRVRKLEKKIQEARFNSIKEDVKSLFRDKFYDVLENGNVLVGLDNGNNVYTLSINDDAGGLEAMLIYHDIDDGTKCAGSRFVLDSEESLNEFESALEEIE